MGKRTRVHVKQEEGEEEEQQQGNGIGLLGQVGGRRKSTRIAGAVGAAGRGAIEENHGEKEEVAEIQKVKLEKKEEEGGEEGIDAIVGFADETPAKPTSPSKATTSASAAAAAVLQARKLKSFTENLNKSPFPNFAHPTPSECEKAVSILSSMHGARQRPDAATLTAPSKTAGCGDSPSVLDALVRTILSQNTTDGNSTRAKLSMDAVYGRSDNWAAIVAGGQEKLEAAIRCGGLAGVKSRVIINILHQVHDRYHHQQQHHDDTATEMGKKEDEEDKFEDPNKHYSLDDLHTATTQAAYSQLLSFQGVGPKTASCVLLFCLGRESFAVDTHVWRIATSLGWVPNAHNKHNNNGSRSAVAVGREATQAHLDVRIPDHLKYPLHVLMVMHGKKCDECRAGGRRRGKCELRREFAGAGAARHGGDVQNGENEEAEEEEEGDEVEDEDEDRGGRTRIKTSKVAEKRRRRR